jgi:integrase/recombinase XerD
MLMVKQQVNDQDYDYDNRINRHLSKCKEVLSQNDCELVKKYHTQMIITSMAIATQSKNLEIIASLSSMIDQEWTTMTKDSINNLVANVMRKYAKNGQETHTTYDHKKILKLFFRFVKLGNRLHKKVGTPDELFDVEMKTVPNNLVREQLIDEKDISALITHSLNLRDKAMWSVAYEAGLRVGEFCKLQLKHVAHDKNGFLISVKGKSGARKVRLHSSQVELGTWLNTHPLRDDPESPLWITLDSKSEKMKPDAVRMQLGKTVKRAKLKKRIYMHLFRHSEITRIVLKTSDLTMKERHGFSANSKMIARYSHLNQDDHDKEYLKAIGVEVIETETKERIPITCKICNTLNAPDQDLCAVCAKPLTMQKAIQFDSQPSYDKKAMIEEFMPTMIEVFVESFGINKKENKLSKADLSKMSQEEKDSILEKIFR